MNKKRWYAEIQKGIDGLRLSGRKNIHERADCYFQ